MTKEIYLKKADAENAVREFIALWGGWWAESSAESDTKFNYVDRDFREKVGEWGGETQAFRVYGCRNGMAGLFAYWED